MRGLQLRAYGKINLGLDVLGVRENGYHDVRMIMQMVDIYDEITLQAREQSGITISSDDQEIPCDERNLAYKAAKLLMDEFEITEGLHIHLQKVIPVAAGMAGGSSDAATVMHGVNELFQLGLSVEELCKRGVTLGADIPYCIMRGTALSEGIGEILSPLPAPPSGSLVIAKPPIGVSTKEVYTALDRAPIENHPDIDGLIVGLENGDLSKIAQCLGNVLEDVTVKMHPEITALKQLMINGGALGALMSGSGPTVFGLFEQQEDAVRVKEAIAQAGLAKELFVTTFVNV